MLNEISEIKLQGANFQNETSFPFFETESGLLKSTIIYGRNGTGKSTISRAFNKLSGKQEESIISAEVFDKQKRNVILSDNERQRIFVFNEDFVDRNVKTRKNGLDTIVILGQQVELDNQIEEKRLKLRTIEKKIKKQQQKSKQYKDNKNVNSPFYWKNKLSQVLRGDNNWAGRDSEIESTPNNKRRKNTPVTGNTYLKFVNLVPSESREKLMQKFNLLRDKKQLIESGNIQLNNPVPSVETLNDYISYPDQNLKHLLATKITKPELSQREKELLTLLNLKGPESLEEREKAFSRDTLKKCPYCFQTLTTSYKNNLVKEIEIVLNKQVQEHQDKLQKFIINQLDMNIDHSLTKLNNYQAVMSLLKELNVVVKQKNMKVTKKIADPYTPIYDKIESLSEVAKKLKKKLFELEKERQEFNSRIKDTTELVENLHSINNQLAYYDIKEPYERYVEKESESSAAEKQLESCHDQYKQISEEIKELESQKRNTRIAVQSINSFLNYIFGTNKRLQLRTDSGNEYTLISRGHAVKPSEVSEGERDILGLCYFFTQLLEGKEISQAYSEECLLVIDDPISSFDEENKVGILSFLKLQLDNFLGKNKNSRSLLLTHDIQIFFDISKIFSELKNKYKGRGWGKIKYNQFQLEKGKLQNIKSERFNRYNFCLEQIYKFGVGKSIEYEDIIGNMMRQVLEAFTTFKYQEGTTEVSNDNKILKSLENPYRAYFYNLMYRLVLNGDSHLKDNVRSMDDLNFFATKPTEEKQRIARDILCLIYKLDYLHLECHSKNISDFKIEDVQQWCEDIKKSDLPELEI